MAKPDSVSAIPILPQISDQDVFLEIGSMGAGHASAALSTVLHEKIDVEIPRLHAKAPNLVTKIYPKNDTPVAAVFMQLRSSTSCDIVLVFDADEAKKIASMMTTSAEDVDEELESSAIEELGSIMISSFLNAVANFAGTKLVPNPPELVFGSIAKVVKRLLAKEALSGDVAEVFDARFRRSTSSAVGYLIMVPNAELRNMLAQKGKQWLVEGEPTVNEFMVSVN